MLKSSTSLKLAAITAALILAGCATKPKATAEAQPAASSGIAQSNIVPGSVKDFQVNVGDTVHFDYNKSDLHDSDRAVLQRQAAWLQKYPTVRVQVQGNCDERGTREYNLALGARRASAVKDYLVSLGVSASRLETISYGKERPVCTQSTEDCWAQNRRAVTAIQAGATS
ncbi:MAG: peptidoglycan-associated lipoprotein Pal [Alphaproteobacteria bacterium]|nr:peptidoglycan-associated lipoprotein Pal [Alphaproteobacteria bacterium]MBU6473789.1 peptidoglycan-associated lipoprotein Pal [Alphaproteobacteria bacterium]MDE2012438.1 peptidoglycan-associated lipoprotein Pal [Alphaproteobacteria bacterium]MDE2072076.1 peptidoglycan-associated lipoprotein Pal [Alphaproteobacteria bacterium]MDE2352356.1 peptidoglycan-associated lipoprotein Pal [Alphaproteobacteria bacterium]